MRKADSEFVRIRTLDKLHEQIKYEVRGPLQMFSCNFTHDPFTQNRLTIDLF